MALNSQLSGELTCNGYAATYKSTYLSIEILGGRVNVGYAPGYVSIEQVSKAIEHITEINALIGETNDTNPYRGQ
ncbi:MAG: hypothetical protein [Caudoviricetes sp.]|nr:MAG: hypothetical protein [Caudoviricetes sp.]